MKPIKFILVVVAFMSMLSFFVGIFLSSDLDVNSNEDVFHSDLLDITSSTSIIDSSQNEQQHVQTLEKYNHDKRVNEKEHQQSQEKISMSIQTLSMITQHGMNVPKSLLYQALQNIKRIEIM